MKMFKTNSYGGVWMEFSNGWTVSIQSGEFSNSSDNTVELAAWPSEGEMFEFKEGDIVKSYVTVDQMADFIQFIKNKDRF